MRQEKLFTNVEIIGVNRSSANSDYYNQITSVGRTMPWLQDTAEARVWTSWAVAYRDVIVLDSSNRVVGVMNLSINDLGVTTNRARLKEMFRAAANSGDSDGDQLPDHWEYHYIGNLDAGPDLDSDNDKFSNFMELAFGSNPKDRTDFPRVQLDFNPSKQFRVSFNRWGGSAGDYIMDSSTNLLQWTNTTQLLRSNTFGIFDGTGRTKTSFNFSRATTIQPRGFMKLNIRRPE